MGKECNLAMLASIDDFEKYRDTLPSNIKMWGTSVRAVYGS